MVLVGCAPELGAEAPVERSKVAYVQSKPCVMCHPDHDASWRRTFHRTMTQLPTPLSVLGDFGDATYTYQGVTSRFTERGGRYVIETLDRETKGMRAYEVAFTVGSRRIQQYVVSVGDRHVRGPAPGRSAATPPDSPSDAAARARRPNWSSLLSQSDAWFASPAGRGIVATVLAHQTPLGDWPKNTNTTLVPVPPVTGAGEARTRGTFDNGATVSELRFLARAFGATGDPAASNAVARGLRHLLEAQLPPGGWPQSHPPGSGYARHITLNDDTMVHLMELVREAASAADFAFLEAALRNHARSAFDRGVECLLRCQVHHWVKTTSTGTQDQGPGSWVVDSR